MSTAPISPLTAAAVPDARDFGDFDTTRTQLYDNVRSAAQAFEPVSNQRYRMELHDVDYDGPEHFSLADQKRAILEGRSLGRRLRGTWRLMDPAGQQVDERRVTLASVPFLTQRGTYVFNGNDYGLAHQQRLRPGVFAREKENGELESHVNVSRGLGHRYFLDPETGVFRVQLGQARIPIVPLLQALGVPERDMRQAWGNEVFQANMQAADTRSLKKIHQRLFQNKPVPEDREAINQSIMQAFSEMELDPEVTQATLGESHTKMGPKAAMAAIGKLLRIHRGEGELDDRDAMAYQRLLGPEDLFAERIRKARGDAGRALWKATFAGNLGKLSSGMFDRSMRGTLLETGLGNSLEEINPAELLDQSHRVTRMGEGGIPSTDAVPDEARNVQPSHLGFIDPVHTPESSKIGVDGRIAYLTKKGKDGRLYSRYRDATTGEVTWQTPQALAGKVVAFPGEMKNKEPYARVVVNGRMRMVPKNQVNFELEHMSQAFGPLANMIPLKANAFPQRVSMGSRMLTQALPLINGEAPLVQSGMPGEDRSFEDMYGTAMGAQRSKIDGKVVSVSADEIRIQGSDRKIHTVELYNNFPYNRKTFIHNTPSVEIGQHIKAGDLLAMSNFTDKSGTTALGLNARVAYIPWKGMNYEDAMVVSQSFANRAKSEHAYQAGLDLDEGVEHGLHRFVSSFPGRFDRHILKNFDEDGVVKPGTTVKHDDPLILAVKQRQTGPQLGRRQRSFADASVTWDHHSAGVVTDVVKGKNGINVVVKSSAALEQGDKLAGRYGDKGVVARILPDNQMPTGADGKPFEVLLNPEGVPSRGNPSQNLETALGKLAQAVGHPIKVPDFSDNEDLNAWVERQLEAHGISPEETIYDPDENRHIPSVLTGHRFIMKLHHMAEGKLQGRDIGGYSSDETPAKGGKEGSKRLGMLELNALLSHGAYDVIRDASLVRGQANPDYWRQVMSGYNPPQPDVPYTWRKFVHQLQASGINPIREGTKTHLLAMTDKDVNELSGDREIKNHSTVDWKVSKLSPIKGGLFDETLTGGHGGERWSHIKLFEPLPNPIMEEPIRRILNLTEPKFNAILSGQDELNGQTGPAAIAQALDKIDIPKEIAAARQAIAGSRKTHRDIALRKMKYLKAAEQHGLHPRDWMMSKVPVLPPKFRPVSLMKGGTPLVADPNFLYKELLEANDVLKTMHGQVDDVGEEQLNLYNAFKGVTGLGDPIQPKHQEQQVKGILKTVFGCYDEQTEICTSEGWVRFAELVPGVPVGTLNPDTGAFEWQIPTDHQRYRYVGELAEIKHGNRIDLLLTPNHRNWIRNRLKAVPDDSIEQGWDFETAAETVIGSGRKWFRTAASAWQGHVDLPPFVPEGCTSVTFASLVGWWVAEGWIHSDGKIVHICQETARNALKCELIEAAVAATGFTYTVHDYPNRGANKTTNCRQWTIKSAELADWLTAHCGSLAHHKRLSRFIKDWDSGLLQAMLLSYLGGDGGSRDLAAVTGEKQTHKHRSELTDTYDRLHTTSKELYDDFAEVCCKLGLTLRPHTGRDADGNQRELFRGGVSGQRFTQQEGQDGKQFVQYDGYVYCCTVPNGIVLVRRNGLPVFSGNSSPKFGTVQRKLLGSTVDLVGRATITPNPDLNMDEVGLPVDKAWTMYRPFVVRRLVRRGMGRMQALQAVKDRTSTAMGELQKEMEHRPLIINRAPSLHRYSIMAFYPKLTQGKTLEIPPIVTSGFSADFDGDAMNFHLPGTEDAVENAKERMLPSRNLLSAQGFGVHYLPSQEYIAGLYEATTNVDHKKTKRVFRSKQDALNAYRRGDINLGQKVEILEH